MKEAQGVGHKATAKETMTDEPEKGGEAKGDGETVDKGDKKESRVVLK